MGDLQIERSGSQEEAKLSLTLTSRELALMALALDPSDSDGEVRSASIKFVESLRSRGVSGSAFEPLVHESEPVDHHHAHDNVSRSHRHVSDFEQIASYVLDQLTAMQGASLLENLRAQFMAQVANYRV
jgi:UDP-glucose 6-dehydrogenase